MSYIYKNKAGRSKNGFIVLRSRCHKHLNKCVLINYGFIFFKSVSLVLGVFKQLTNSVFISLIKFGCGALTYCAMTHGTVPGQFKFFIYFRRLRYKSIFKAGCRVFVKLISNKTVFCQLILNNKKYSKYIRAAGTYTRLYQRYKDAKMISCRLPTKQKCYITYETLITLGRNSNIRHKKEFLTTAGANIKKGFKSKVRGVAMNPVDHPHGGRTKSNSPERSP